MSHLSAPVNDHQKIERQVSAMHHVIAARLSKGDLTPLTRARTNLERWREQFGGVLPLPYAEWVTLIDAGLERVLEVLAGDDQDSIRRRSNSPFTGVLTPQERWQILRRAT